MPRASDRRVREAVGVRRNREGDDHGGHRLPERGHEREGQDDGRQRHERVHRPPVRRTQLQLDEETYAALRRRAYEERRSLSSVARDLLAAALRGRGRKRRLTMRDFAFIGVGRSRQAGLSPVSEHHDEALAEAFANPRRR